MNSPTQTGNANMKALSAVEREYLMPLPYIGQMLHWWPGATSQQKPIAGVCCDTSDGSININLFVSDSSTEQPHSGVRWKRDPRPIPSKEVSDEGVWDFIDRGEMLANAELISAFDRAERVKAQQDAELLATHPKVANASSTRLPSSAAEWKPSEEMTRQIEATAKANAALKEDLAAAVATEPPAAKKK